MSAPDSLADSWRAILEVLDRHGVEYVVIGGVAAVSRGWRGRTSDIDITPRRDRTNFARLASVLNELGARFRVTGNAAGFEPPGGIDVRTLERQVSLALLTDSGDLDVSIIPDGTEGFPDLVMRATYEMIPGTGRKALVAAAEDIIRSKRAAGRAKDRSQIPAMQEDFARHESEEGDNA